MAQDRDVVIHIGLRKTGTTTLQERVFEHHPQLRFVGKNLARREILDVSGTIVGQDNLMFDAAACKHRFEELVAATAGDGPVLMSDEEFTSGKADRSLIATRLRDVCGPSKIIFVIRRPDTWLESLYWYSWMAADSSRAMPYDEWLARRLGDVDISKIDGNDIHFQNTARAANYYNLVAQFQYYRTAAFYADVFGDENILVIAYEQLRDDPAGFVSTLCRFMDIDTSIAIELLGTSRDNRRATASVAAYKRLVVHRPLVGRLARVAPSGAKQKVRAAVERRSKASEVTQPPALYPWLKDMFGDEYRQIMERWNVPLDSYGYPLR